MAEQKVKILELETELKQLRSLRDKIKAQQQKKRARQQQKKAAATATTSEEDSDLKLDESAAETSEQLAALSFKDVVAGASVTAAGRRRKSSPAALNTTQEPAGVAVTSSIPIDLMRKLLGLGNLNRSSVEKAIGELYKGPVANLRPLWQQLMPNKELPSTKALAMGELYQLGLGFIQQCMTVGPMCCN